METLEWKVPHNEQTLAAALDVGNMLLAELVKRRNGGIKDFFQQTSGDSRDFKLTVVYVEFSGVITADRDDIIYKMKRPNMGMYFGQEIRKELQVMGPEFSPARKEEPVPV